MMLASPLTLPCGQTLPNRLAKAAMTEGLTADGVPNDGHLTLYRRWAASRVGLQLTGNVQIDRDHLERPGNVVIDRAPDAAMLAALRAWAGAAREGGGKVWMQLSHAGRQTPSRVNPAPKAPSAVPLALPGKQFGQPVALTEPEIVALIARFAVAARAAADAGFDGVQVHAAHGYLASQFLNPRANRRTDAWGGALENRARFLLDAVRAVRAATGSSFAVSVKLNSADFQRGGFAFDESVIVAGWLKAAGVDMLEISGGSYEQPRMMAMDGLEAVHAQQAATTRSREAYFLDFASQMLRAETPPLMVTGGFRTRAVMEEALTAGVSVIGIGRPMCADPAGPAAILAGTRHALGRDEDRLRLGPGLFGPASPLKLLKAINGFATTSWYYGQLRRLAAGQEPDPGERVLSAFLAEQRADKAIAIASRNPS